MNILYVIGWPLGQGGHINSTLALSKSLIEQHEIKNIYLLAPKGEKASYFKQAKINYIELPNPKKLWFFRLLGGVLILFYALRYRINVIHAMDYKGLIPSVMANLFLCKVLVFTKAGGSPLKVKLPLLSYLVVFSKELLDFYKDKSLCNKNIALIKERIDLDEFNRISSNSDLYGVFTIFIAMRLSPSKKFLLDSLFNELEKLESFNERINIVIAGDGELMEECLRNSKLIMKQNDLIQFEYLGQLNNKEEIYRQYLNSNLTVGHGRGIMEAMAIGKPVMLLGFDKLASVLVNELNVGQIAENNFSGRQIKLEKTSIGLAKLVSSDNRQHILSNAGIFNATYITNNYSAEIGGNKLKAIYLKANKQSFKGVKYNLKWIINRL